MMRRKLSGKSFLANNRRVTFVVLSEAIVEETARLTSNSKCSILKIRYCQCIHATRSIGTFSTPCTSLGRTKHCFLHWS